MNTYEFCFVHMMRSGSHAIMNWIASQFDNVTFYNWINETNSLTIKDIKAASETLVYNHQPIQDHNDCVMYSFEELSPSDVKTHYVMNNREQLFGQSRNFKMIAIWRNPLNLWASRKKKKLVTSFGKIHKFWDQCKDTYTIDYDKWFTDEDYRFDVLLDLDLPVVNLDNTIMSEAGQGSSFSKLDYKNDPSKLDVLNRWKHYQNNPEFIKFKKQCEDKGVI